MYIPSRTPIIEHKNCNGERLGLLNGRSQCDNFTCILSNGRSVVDYYIVQADYFQSIYIKFHCHNYIRVLR